MTTMPTTNEEWESVWQHFNRIQQKVMADKTTKEEFFSEDENDRWSFYQWICCQISNPAWV